jgi:hypothetical protein
MSKRTNYAPPISRSLPATDNLFMAHGLLGINISSILLPTTVYVAFLIPIASVSPFKPQPAPPGGHAPRPPSPPHRHRTDRREQMQGPRDRIDGHR